MGVRCPRRLPPKERRKGGASIARLKAEQKTAWSNPNILPTATNSLHRLRKVFWSTSDADIPYGVPWGCSSRDCMQSIAAFGVTVISHGRLIDYAGSYKTAISPSMTASRYYITCTCTYNTSTCTCRGVWFLPPLPPPPRVGFICRLQLRKVTHKWITSTWLNYHRPEVVLRR